MGEKKLVESEYLVSDGKDCGDDSYLAEHICDSHGKDCDDSKYVQLSDSKYDQLPVCSTCQWCSW